MRNVFFKFVIPFFFLSILLPSTVVFAQSSDYSEMKSLVMGTDVEKEREDEGEKENKLLGRVVAIELGGAPSTKPHVIISQLTFKEGEVIYVSDIALSYKRLYQLGLFSYVRIRTENVEDEDGNKTIVVDPDLEKAPDGVGDIVVYVEVWQGFSHYLFPSTSGASIGDKDIFLSGKTLEAAYFKSGSSFLYWHMRYADPQFAGSHNTANFMVSHLKDLYGVRDEFNYDLGERYSLNRDAFKFTLNTLYDEDYKVSFGFEWQDNDTEHTNGSIFADTNKFFLSDEEFTPGKALIYNFDISRYAARGNPWANSGYSWSLGTDQALSGLGSDYSFGRYHLKGTVLMPIDSIIDTAVLHGAYSFTSGNPPHYQKPRLGYRMRGHDGLDYFGDSTVFLSGELRKAMFNNQVQGVAFVDLGKGFDSRTLSFNDLDMSTGFGIRVNVSRLVGMNIVLRADYGWGEEGSRLTFGIGQWIY
jgi:outer membrane protein assembly factor BamA